MITQCKWSLMPVHTVHVWKQSVATPYKLEHVTWCDLTLCADSNIFIRAPTWRGASRLTSLVVIMCHKIHRLSNIKFSNTPWPRMMSKKTTWSVTCLSVLWQWDGAHPTALSLTAGGALLQHTHLSLPSRKRIINCWKILMLVYRNT